MHGLNNNTNSDVFANEIVRVEKILVAHLVSSKFLWFGNKEPTYRYMHARYV